MYLIRFNPCPQVFWATKSTGFHLWYYQWGKKRKTTKNLNQKHKSTKNSKQLNKTIESFYCDTSRYNIVKQQMMYSIARTKQQHSHVTCKRKHCKEFEEQWGTAQRRPMTRAWGLKPFPAVLLEGSSAASAPFTEVFRPLVGLTWV